MNQLFTDKLAIAISAVCAVHCLILPFALIWVPSIASLHLDNEGFHLWMLLAVVPISIYALTTGCIQHKRYQLLILGIVGLGFLVLAILLGDFIGEFGEKGFTLFGTGLLAVGHFLNYRSCRSHKENCDCLGQ